MHMNTSEKGWKEKHVYQDKIRDFQERRVLYNLELLNNFLFNL